MRDRFRPYLAGIAALLLCTLVPPPAAHADPAYNARLLEHISKILLDDQVMAIAGGETVKFVRVRFAVDEQGRIVDVRAYREYGSINLRRLLERKVRSLPRFEPPPSGKKSHYAIPLRFMPS